MRTTTNPGGTCGRGAKHGGWGDAGGLIPPVVAVVLWIVTVAGIAAPLGEALARMEARRGSAAPAAVAERAPCAVPCGALASAATPGETACR